MLVPAILPKCNARKKDANGCYPLTIAVVEKGDANMAIELIRAGAIPKREVAKKLVKLHGFSEEICRNAISPTKGPPPPGRGPARSRGVRENSPACAVRHSPDPFSCDLWSRFAFAIGGRHDRASPWTGNTDCQQYHHHRKPGAQHAREARSSQSRHRSSGQERQDAAPRRIDDGQAGS